MVTKKNHSKLTTTEKRKALDTALPAPPATVVHTGSQLNRSVNVFRLTKVLVGRTILTIEP